MFWRTKSYSSRDYHADNLLYSSNLRAAVAFSESVADHFLCSKQHFYPFENKENVVNFLVSGKFEVTLH